MRSIYIFALVIASLVACHKSDDNGQQTDGATPDGPSISGTKYEITWGSVQVAPGVEDTQCVILQLPNTTAIKVHQIENHLSSASHHVIVYRDNMDTVEKTTPFDCQPFTGALNPTGMVSPMMISQKMDDLLTLPDGVAYTLAPNQFIRLEMHYINSGETEETATETTDFYAADPATIQNEADLLFIGSPDIGTSTGAVCSGSSQSNGPCIPAGSMYTLHEFFTPPAGSTFLQANIFAITGHEHRTGTGVVIKTGTSATDNAMSTVYNPTTFLWSEPPTVAAAPPFNIPTGGGFDFTCNWNNTTAAPVAFGESATDEMCFFWAYYYPSAGAHVCIHTSSYGGANGLNVCCPAAAGDAIASAVCSKIAAP